MVLIIFSLNFEETQLNWAELTWPNEVWVIFYQKNSIGTHWVETRFSDRVLVWQAWPRLILGFQLAQLSGLPSQVGFLSNMGFYRKELKCTHLMFFWRNAFHASIWLLPYLFWNLLTNQLILRNWIFIGVYFIWSKSTYIKLDVEKSYAQVISNDHITLEDLLL